MEKLKAIVADILRIEKNSIGEDTSLQNTTSWDSLRHMELIVGIESTYEIEFTGDEIVELTSWGAISSLLKSKGVLDQE